MPTPFQNQVYSLTKKIPLGKVSTYQEIARAIAEQAKQKYSSLLCRAVGNALNKNPYAPAVPCHRVIKSDSSLGGFAFGQKKKKHLLKQERVEIIQNKVALKHFFRLTQLPRSKEESFLPLSLPKLLDLPSSKP